MDTTPYSAAVFGFSSTFSFTMVILSACSPAISSRIGDTWRHGPHHSAQKSTRTGLSLSSTSAVKVASVTDLVLLPTVFPFTGGDCPAGGCPNLGSGTPGQALMLAASAAWTGSLVRTASSSEAR